MNRIAIILAVLLSFAAAAPAQDHTGRARVQGFVTDESGAPLAGVKVKLLNVKTKSGFETTTDAAGVWKANWIKGGAWYLDFELAGYVPRKLTAEFIESQKNPVVEVKMVKMAGLMLTDDLKADLVKGNLLFEEKKYEEARAVYQGILDKFPGAYVLHLSVGNCFFALENYDAAEAEYKKVLEKEPAHYGALLGVGNCYQNRGDQAQALAWYRKIAFEKLDDPVVLYNIGTSLYNSSQFEEALKYYQRSVELKADFLDGIYQLGLVYLNLQNKPEAIRLFESYLKIDPDSGRAAQVRSFLEYLKKDAWPA